MKHTLEIRSYLDKARRTPYKEGKHDCGTFLLGWLDYLSGTSFREQLTPYVSVLQGKRDNVTLGWAKTGEDYLKRARWHKVDDGEDGDIVWLDIAHWGIYYQGRAHGVLLGCTGCCIFEANHILQHWRGNNA